MNAKARRQAGAFFSPVVYDDDPPTPKIDPERHVSSRDRAHRGGAGVSLRRS